MLNQKVLASVMVIGIIGSLTVVSGTAALMSDTETGIADIAAGTIDLELGLSNGNGPGNDEFVNGGTATIFDIDDAKPLDRYESTIAFRVTDNPSYVCSTLEPVRNAERGLIEPEKDAGDTTQGPFEGELGDYLTYSVWVDDGDNIYEDGVGDNGEGSDDVDERYIIVNETVPTQNGSVLELPLMDSNYNAFDTTANGEPLTPGETKYLGAEVHFVDGPDVNQAQSDRYTAQYNVTTVQSRSNDEYICPGGPINEQFPGSQRGIFTGDTPDEVQEETLSEPVALTEDVTTVSLGQVDPNVATGVTVELYNDDVTSDVNNRVATVDIPEPETDTVTVTASDLTGNTPQNIEAVRLVGATNPYDVVIDNSGTVATYPTN